MQIEYKDVSDLLECLVNSSELFTTIKLTEHDFFVLKCMEEEGLVDIVGRSMNGTALVGILSKGLDLYYRMPKPDANSATQNTIHSMYYLFQYVENP